MKLHSMVENQQSDLLYIVNYFNIKFLNSDSILHNFELRYMVKVAYVHFFLAFQG